MKNKSARAFPVIRLLVLLFAFFISHLTAAEPTYSVTDLGQINPTAINDAGQVTGYTGFNPNAHAFLYSNGILSDLGTLGGPASYGYGINNLGHVVGSADAASVFGRAFLYDGHAMTDIGTLGSLSEAIGINDGGQIAGSSYTQDGVEHAFLYTNSSLHDLGTLEGDTFSIAQAINHSSHVVGFSYSPGGARERAFVYSGGVMNNISVGIYSRAMDINDSGNIVGFWDDSPVYIGSHAFSYSNGAFTDLGTLGGPSYARGINNTNQIVGVSGGRAFLYEGGVMQDLNILIAEDSGWVLIETFAINNVGQIIGTGTHNGEQRAFLLTPSTPPLPHENVAVVLVHGIDGAPSSFDQMRALLQQEGLSVSAFDYSKLTPHQRVRVGIHRGRSIWKKVQWPIQDLAGELAKHICEKVKRGTLRRNGICSKPGQVDVVAHSMGGLVTRAYITGMASNKRTNAKVPYHESNSVRKLVMAGTPNYGATIAGLTDLAGGTRPGGNQQIKAMQYGSGFIWTLDRRWRSFAVFGDCQDRKTLCKDHLLVIAGTQSDESTFEGDDDGVVKTSSAALPLDLPPGDIQYLPYKHYSGVRPFPGTTLVGVKDPDHLTYQLARAFLLGAPLPAVNYVSPASVTDRGLLLIRLVDQETQRPVELDSSTALCIHRNGILPPLCGSKNVDAGTFTIPALREGQYTLSVSPPRGYKRPDPITVTIEGGRPMVLDPIELMLKSGH